MIKREFGIFLIVGSLATLIDFSAYRGLVLLELTSVNIAKAIGFLIGTIFAYIANSIWTFSHKNQALSNLWKFAALYGITMETSVLINALVLKIFFDKTAVVYLAFLLATGVSATLNFLGMKLFVFK